MKQLSCVVIVIGCLVGAAGSVLAQKVDSYTTDLEIRTDGSVLVAERLTWSTGESKEMLWQREIPLRFEKHKMLIQPVSAVWNNSQELIELQETERTATINIGTPGVMTQAGGQELVLTYVVEGAIHNTGQANRLVFPAYQGGNVDLLGQFAASVQVVGDYPIQELDCQVQSLLRSDDCSIPPRIEGESLGYYAHTGVDAGNDIVVSVEFESGITGSVFSARFTWWEWVLVVLAVLGLAGAAWWGGHTVYRRYQR